MPRSRTNPNSLSTILLVCTAAVVLNITVGWAVGLLTLSFLFLDTVGTFIAAALFGIRWGLLVGVVTNVVIALTFRPQAIWFVVVQIAVAVVVGAVSRPKGYTVASAPIAAAILAVLVPLLSTIIVVAVFKGAHGNPVDDAVAGLQAAGNSLFSAAFWPRAGLELIDKVVTAVIALVVVKGLTGSIIAPRHTVDSERREAALVR
ncbi:ECF transporter S component [Tessaracoccus sp. SD287]|uniref:hypothetical protein n=1 Tax=Tessaracoccus sp. SD287 TaxID=2782008 RepID=UPI001A95ECBC|nr:hypothetical protein [Tessaracoccus sp. SD287]MBO1031380.1 ECF transporter S component [Tessaracoccus sp. SD287]